MRKSLITLIALTMLAAISFAGTINGVVVDTNGEPVVNARVMLGQVPADDDTMRHHRPRRHFVGRALSGEDGTFSFDDLEGGTYMIAAFLPRAGGDHQEIEVLEDGIVEVTLTIAPPEDRNPDNPPRRRPPHRRRHRPGPGGL